MHYRTIWISDVHLGTRGSSTQQLLEFLRQTDSDTLYLVGDIVDGWRLKSKLYWPQCHTDIIQKILRKSRKGTKVIYVPGNHDEFLRDYAGTQFGNISLERDHVHITADGRRVLVMHGDEFDGVTTYHKWLAHLGDWAYNSMIVLNRYFNWTRRKLGFDYWSLSAYCKRKVKHAVNFISHYEDSVARECKNQGFDGIVTGHIHHAEIRQIHGVQYYNCGDWVESCTALVEHHNGKIEIVKFHTA